MRESPSFFGGGLRSDVRIGEFFGWASCYASSATAAFGPKPPFANVKAEASFFLEHRFGQDGCFADFR
jgi:hypothetical protein